MEVIVLENKGKVSLNVLDHWFLGKEKSYKTITDVHKEMIQLHKYAEIRSNTDVK